jgi:hypothetical protein
MPSATMGEFNDLFLTLSAGQRFTAANDFVLSDDGASDSICHP